MKARSTTSSLVKPALEKFEPVYRQEKRGLYYYLPIVLLITLFAVIIVEVSST